MRKLTLISTLIFSTLMFSSTSFAGWTEVARSVHGTTFYVDFERVRKHGGYTYFWQLTDYLKPLHGDFSAIKYNQTDCKLLRYKRLSFSWHKEPMGRGSGHIDSNPDKEWNYPSPKSAAEAIHVSVCSR